MAVESKTAIRYCAKTMKKAYIFAQISFLRKKLGFQLHFWTTESCRDGNLWEETASARSTIAEKIWLFVILASRPRKLFMVSASFWTTKSCKTEISQKSGTRQIQVCRETKAFCNTCKHAEKTVYGLSFILDDTIVQKPIFAKKIYGGYSKNIAKFRVGKV